MAYPDSGTGIGSGCCASDECLDWEPAAADTGRFLNDKGNGCRKSSASEGHC